MEELIDKELKRVETEEESEDRTAQLQRLATAHKTLTETQHRDELHAMRLGDPDAPIHGVADPVDEEAGPSVHDFEEAKRRARRG